MSLPRVLFDVGDVGEEAIATLLARAAALASGSCPPRALDGKVVALCFAQPSTRTRVGFAAAAARLGGAAVDVAGPKFQDGMDGPESFADTARVLGDYCAIVVLRHSSAAAVREFADAAAVPVINGGAGRIAHPTQALIDLYAIHQRFGSAAGLRIGIAGDLITSRTGRSLFNLLLRVRPSEIRLMAPTGRHWDDVDGRVSAGIVARRDDCWLDGLDVLYVAGMPPGGGEEKLSSAVREDFYLDPARLAQLPPTSIVLCALPRTGDIDPSVDGDSRSQYFQQSANGLFVRMALLEAYAGWPRS